MCDDIVTIFSSQGGLFVLVFVSSLLFLYSSSLHTKCCSFLFFFSSRLRHTCCALVTGVQTCALPIWRSSFPAEWWCRASAIGPIRYPAFPMTTGRSDERRVGKECVSTCRSRWSP